MQGFEEDQMMYYLQKCTDMPNRVRILYRKTFQRNSSTQNKTSVFPILIIVIINTS